MSEFFELVERGDVDRVREQLAAQPDLVQARDAKGATALHLAALHGHRELVTLLLERGADINARDTLFGATPSGWAIEYLREHGGLLAVEIDDLLHAIRTRDVYWAQRLIARHPVLVQASDAAGKPLAQYAKEAGATEVVRLFDRGARF